MTGVLEQFLNDHPLKSRWLNDIISSLLNKPRGTAHVRDLVKELWGDRDIESIEQTIYRRINDFCADAQDWDKPPQYNLFQKVERGVYRLRSFPERPKILELIQIEFEDAAMQQTWLAFRELARKNPRWPTVTNEQRLTAFAKKMQQESWRSRYTFYQELQSQPLSGLDDLIKDI